MTEVDSILHDLINQLVSVSIPSDTMHREEHIRNLTPIINVSEGASAPNEPEGTFLVGKLKPKDAGTTIIDDIINPVTCKELYPFYMELPQEEFVIRLNKTLYDYVRQQLEQAKANHVPDSDNIWMQPNAEFFNYFQEQGIDIDTISPLLQNTISDGIEDWNAPLYELADRMRMRKDAGEFDSYRNAYRWAVEHMTINGQPIAGWNKLERAYEKAKDQGLIIE